MALSQSISLPFTKNWDYEWIHLRKINDCPPNNAKTAYGNYNGKNARKQEHQHNNIIHHFWFSFRKLSSPRNRATRNPSETTMKCLRLKLTSIIKYPLVGDLNFIFNINFRNPESNYYWERKRNINQTWTYIIQQQTVAVITNVRCNLHHKMQVSCFGNNKKMNVFTDNDWTV